MVPKDKSVLQEDQREHLNKINIPVPEVGVFWPEVYPGYREGERVYLKSD